MLLLKNEGKTLEVYLDRELRSIKIGKAKDVVRPEHFKDGFYHPNSIVVCIDTIDNVQYIQAEGTEFEYIERSRKQTDNFRNKLLDAFMEDSYR